MSIASAAVPQSDFHSPLTHSRPLLRTRLVWALLTLVVLLGLFAGFHWLGVYSILSQGIHSQTILKWMFIGSQVFAGIGIATFLWRVVLAIRYRSTPGVNDERLPHTTVVVPAYNEGKQVLATIESLVASDFPAAKLSIIAVDDGSQDDTWYWLKQAKEKYPQIEVVHCPKNRGKRHALYEGFRRSRGQVIVTVDSDSLVFCDSLRNLVSPFVQSSRVGAVAGNIRVLNRKSWIPKMLDIVFTYGFEFIRSSESQVNTVMCTPGALSAYRRDLVLEVLPKWLHQRFLGRPVTIGDDRALTNMILRLGYFSWYQSSAIAETKVPTKYPNLCRMLLRWGRSAARENILLTSFIFRSFRDEPKTGARINLVLALLRTVLAPFALALSIVMFCLHTQMMLLAIAVGAVLSAALPATVYEMSRGEGKGLWALPYFLLSPLFLSWIGPYALMTVQKSAAWLTRGAIRTKVQVQPEQPVPRAISPSASSPTRAAVGASLAMNMRSRSQVRF